MNSTENKERSQKYFQMHDLKEERSRKKMFLRGSLNALSRKEEEEKIIEEVSCSFWTRARLEAFQCLIIRIQEALNALWKWLFIDLLTHNTAFYVSLSHMRWRPTVTAFLWPPKDKFSLSYEKFYMHENFFLVRFN